MPDHPRPTYAHFYTPPLGDPRQGGTPAQPRVTVCYLDLPPCTHWPLGWTAVGLAVCSLLDRPCKAIGRRIALQRARWLVGLEAARLPTDWQMLARLPMAPRTWPLVLSTDVDSAYVVGYKAFVLPCHDPGQAAPRLPRKPRPREGVLRGEGPHEGGREGATAPRS